MPVDAVEDTAFGGEVERNEREERGERRSVELTPHSKLVVRGRQYTLEPLLLLEERRLDVDELRFEDRLHLRLELVELVLGAPVEGDVETDVEEPLLGLLELVAQALEILVGGVELRVADEPLFLAEVDLTLHLGDLLAELLEDARGLDRVDEERDVKDLVEVDDRREPAVGEEPRV